MQQLLFIGSYKGHIIKIMPELDPGGLFSLNSVFVQFCMQHTMILVCTRSNFKFLTIAKNASIFGRDMGAKFSINDPKK